MKDRIGLKYIFKRVNL